MQIRMSTGDALPRRAWTEGLEALGQQELGVTLPWPQGDARDEQVMRLLRFIEGYVSSQPRRIMAGQTMKYGWSTLRFVADEQENRLLIEELSNPHTSGESAYVPGASRAVALQEEVLRRLRITGESGHPHRSNTAIVCNRVTPETVGSLRPLQVQRLERPDGRYSGWFVGCVGGGHDHDDADQLEQVHLVHLVARLPGLFPYLALPVGAALLFEAEQVVVFRPGEQEGHSDVAPLLRELP